MRHKSSLCNREFRKRDVVQTYPLEASFLSTELVIAQR
jgi:hypothetical protein